MKNRMRVAGALAGVVMAAAACGGASAAQAPSTSAGKPARATTKVAAAAAQPAPTTTAQPTTTSTVPTIGPNGVGAVQTSLDQQSQPVVVAIRHIYDPAKGSDQFDQAPTGKRLVGVELVVGASTALTPGNAPGSYQDDMNLDVTLTGANGQTYTPSFYTLAGCTNFNNGDVNVSTSGNAADAVGCVAFAVPTSVKVSEVNFAPDGGMGTQTVSWKVGS